MGNSGLLPSDVPTKMYSRATTELLFRQFQGEVPRISLLRAWENRARRRARVLLLSSPYLPAQPSRQGVSVGIVLVAQRPAVAKHHLHLGHLSPRLLRLLALPRSQREELPRLFRAPNQHERHSPWCFVQRPLDEGSPPLDELLLASCPNQPLARAVGPACLLHLAASCPTRWG